MYIAALAELTTNSGLGYFSCVELKLQKKSQMSGIEMRAARSNCQFHLAQASFLIKSLERYTYTRTGCSPEVASYDVLGRT